ncbi:MAG: hypothetical protein K6G26_02595 [Lachnospiraceae bacterium]|nr:hypothetical protein [Lachnospiraceae bacterium]
MRGKYIKRYVTIQLIIALIINMIPFTQNSAFASEFVASVTANNNTTNYTSFSEAISAWTGGSTLKLLADVELSSKVNVTGNRTLDLNGYGIKVTAASNSFVIEKNGKITIKDDDTSGRIHYITLDNYRGVAVSDTGNETKVVDGSGVVKVTGGYLTGGAGQYGGMIYVKNSAEAEINGGTFVGNVVTKGGGAVYLLETKSKCTVNNGTFIYNRANYGGGLYNSRGILTINNAVIKYNRGNNYAGGVHAWAETTKTAARTYINGGIISENIAPFGAGFHSATNAIVNITGGVFTNNINTNQTLTEARGGVYVYGDDRLSLSGNVIIDGNYYIDDNGNKIKANLYFDADTTCKITGELSDYTTIGISMEEPGVFTNGTNVDYKDISKFTSDKAGYIVTQNESQQFYLLETPIELTAVGGKLKFGDIMAQEGYASEGDVYMDCYELPYGNYILNGDLMVNRAIHVNCDGYGNTTIIFDNYNIINNNQGIDFDEGSAIYIDGGNLILNGTTGVLKSINSDSGPRGGGVIATGGSVIMNGGVIKDNIANTGGVYVTHNGTFTMNDGMICDNTGWAGVCNQADFIMNGGEITRNKSAISMWNDNVTLSGTAKIYGNINDEGKDCNLDLGNERTFNAGEFSEGAQIGITMGTKHTFAKDYAAYNNGVEPSTYFKSDDSKYMVSLADNGEAQLEYGFNVTFKVVNGSFDDGTSEDKMVVVKGNEGDVLKLAADQIPDVGTKPADNYTEGIWDVTPDTVSEINEEKVYTYTYEKQHKHDEVEFKAWRNSLSMPDTAGNYYLENDVTISNEWVVPSGVTKICLNGHKITTYNHFKINSNCSLEIYDEEGNGSIDAQYRVGSMFWVNGGSLTINGVIINGNVSTAGIVDIAANAVFTMNGGKITGTSTGRYDASVIRFTGSNGTFAMTGGEISGTTTRGGVTYFEKTDVNINISGDAKIINNKLERGIVQNLYLPDDVKLNIIGQLSDEANIGITMQTPAVFTNTTETSYNDPSKFFSDNEGYDIIKNTDNQLELAKGCTVTYKVLNGTWSDGTTEDKTETVYKSLKPVNVPEGMMAGLHYTGGTWNTNPSETTISEDTTFTYSFVEKTNITPAVTITGWTYGETPNEPSVSGNSGSGAVTYTYSTSENGTYTSDVPTDAGTYYVKASIEETADYYDGNAIASFTIAPKELTDAMISIETASFVHDGNIKTPSYAVKDGITTLTVGNDYTVDTTSTTSSSAYGTYTIKVNGTGNYTKSASATWNITDETAPSAEINIENNKYTSLLNTITFGLFFNKTEMVSISAADEESGVKEIKYVTTDTVATSTEAIDALTGWTTVNGSTASFNIEPDTKFIVYVKVTDNAGNVTYVTSDGITLETTAPDVTIDGTIPMESYIKAVSWSVSDENLKDVVIKYTEEGSTEETTIYNQTANGTILASTANLSGVGNYKIIATDKAGNITEKIFAITRRDAVISGGSDTITYDVNKTYDLSKLFTFEDGITISSYVIVDNEDANKDAGEGVITGSNIVISKVGLITIKAKVETGTTNTQTPEFIKETTKTATLSIVPKELTDTMLVIEKDTFEHDGNVYAPVYEVKDGEYILVSGTDYRIDSESTTSAAAYGTYTIKINGTGNYKGNVSFEWNIIDNIKPSAEIIIENNKFKTFLNKMTFGLFFNKTETVTITAADSGSGVKELEYLVTSVVATTKEEVDALEGTWTKVTESTVSFNIDPEDKYIIYVKVTDKALNEVYISSDGIIIDATGPVITIDDSLPNESYNKAVSWSVTDDNLENVTIVYKEDGSTEEQIVYNQDTTGNALTSIEKLSGLGSYTITAIDKAGNEIAKNFVIERRDAIVSGKNNTAVYEAGKTYDVSELFTIESGLNILLYEIVDNEDISLLAGEGSISGSNLTIKKAGIITIKAIVAKGMTDADEPEYVEETSVTGTVVIAKADGTAEIKIEDCIYGSEYSVKTNSTNNVTVNITYTMIKDSAGNDISEDKQSTSCNKPVDAGTYKAVASYETDELYKKAEASTVFTIKPKQLNNSMLIINTSTYKVDGLIKKPEIIVKDGDKVLALEKDYAIDIQSATAMKEAGSYLIKVNGKGNYTGTASSVWTIVENKKSNQAVQTNKDTLPKTISGYILKSDGTPYTSGAVIKFIKDNNVIAKEKSSDDGSYNVNLPDGIYGIVVEWRQSEGDSDITTISDVVAIKNNKAASIVLPSKNVSSVLNVENNAKGVMVAGLTKEAEEIGLANNTSDVSVEMTVKKETEESGSETEAINMLVPTHKFEFFNITVEKTVNSVKTIMDKTNNVLEIIIPYDFENKRELMVYRYHGQNAMELVESDTKEDGTFRLDKDNKLVYIYANQFSIYAIGYMPYFKLMSKLGFGEFEGDITVILKNNENGEEIKRIIVNKENDYVNFDMDEIKKGSYNMIVEWDEGKVNSLTVPVKL